MFKLKSGLKVLVIAIILCISLSGAAAGKQYLSAQGRPAILQGILGEISAQPEFVCLAGQEEVLILPSTSGLYIVKEGEIIKHFYPGKEISSFALLPDLDFDGSRDLAISTVDELLPNILGLSSRTGEVIWWFSPENRIYQEGYGWFAYQPQIDQVISLYEEEQQYLFLTAGSSLYKLDARSGKMIWEYNDSEKIISLAVSEKASDNTVLEIDLLNEKGEAIAVDSGSGQIIGHLNQTGKSGFNVDWNTEKAGKNINSTGAKSSQYQATDSAGRMLITGSPSEIALLDREMTVKIWSLPKFSEPVFLGPADGTKEFFYLYPLRKSGQKETGTGLIQKISAQKEVIWEYFGASLLAEYGGLHKTQLGGDLDQDGISDILGALSPDNPAYGDLPAKVMAINGNNGQLLWEANLNQDAKITSLIQYQDINSDGSPEILIGTSSRFYVLDGASGMIIRDWPHYNLKGEGYFEPTKGIDQEVMLIPAEDVNKDGLTDLFIVSSHRIRLGLSNRVGGLDFYYKELYTAALGDINLTGSHSFPDLDQDGIPELLLVRDRGTQGILRTVISGAEGKLLLEEAGSNLVLQAARADFNSNHTLDIISYEFKENGDGRLRLIDGATGKVLWTYGWCSGEEGIIPACLVDDLNSDGIPELAIVQNTSTGTGIKIDIFDAAGGWEQPLRTLSIQDPAYWNLNRHWALGLLIQRLTQGSGQYLAVTARLGGRDEGAQLILYDYQQEKTAALYPITASSINLMTDFLIVEDLKGRVSLLDFPAGDPGAVLASSTASSSLQLQWQNNEPFVRTKIYIDNVLALETTGETAELAITHGDHLIGVAQYSLSGGHSYQTIPVKVTGAHTLRIVTAVLTAVFLGLVLGVASFFRGRIGAGVKNN